MFLGALLSSTPALTTCEYTHSYRSSTTLACSERKLASFVSARITICGAFVNRENSNYVRDGIEKAARILASFPECLFSRFIETCDCIWYYWAMPRKHLSPELAKCRSYLLTLTADEYARIVQLATEAGLTVSDYVLKKSLGRFYRRKPRKPRTLRTSAEQ